MKILDFIKNNKMHVFVVMSISFALLLFASINANAATSKQTITFYLSEHYDDSTGWGPFEGTFTEHINLSEDMVFFETYQSDGIRNVGYMWLKSNGSIGYEYLILGTNTWLGTYDSSTVDTSSTIYSIDRHVKNARFYGTLVYASLPYFNSLDSAKAYLLNGTVDKDTMLNYDDIMGLPTPYDFKVYNSDVNQYKYFIDFKQNINMLDNCALSYKLDYSVVTDEYYANNADTSVANDLTIKNPGQIIEDLSSILSQAIFNDDDDVALINMYLYNYDTTNTDRYSNTVTVEFRIDKDGVGYRVNGQDDDVDFGQMVWIPLKTESGIVNDYVNDFSNNVIVNDDIGFIEMIVSGFGLLGDNGLIALFSGVFVYVPNFLWILIGTGIAVLIVIALFKAFSK